METVLAISDTQFPFAHKDYLPFLHAVKAAYSPTEVVHIGDMLDYHALSEYDPDPDGDSPGAEFKRGMRDVRNLYDLFPKVHVCLSNHDARPYRRAYKYGIPKDFLKSYGDMLDAPRGWDWGEKFEIDGVLYEHGEGLSGKLGHLKAAEQNMQSTVIGHIHSHAGIAYTANPRYLIFGFNIGCLIDKDAYAFAYGRTFRSKPVLGCGVVKEGIPIFIPMLLRKGGRWVGSL